MLLYLQKVKRMKTGKNVGEGKLVEGLKCSRRKFSF